MSEILFSRIGKFDGKDKVVIIDMVGNYGDCLEILIIIVVVIMR